MSQNDGARSSGSTTPEGASDPTRSAGLRVVNRPAISPGRLAFEQAWEGWLRQAIVLGVLLISAIAYYAGFISDLPIAMLVGAGLLVIPLVMAGQHTVQMIDDAHLKSWVWFPLIGGGLVGVLCVAATLFPGKEIYAGSLSGVLSEVTFQAPSNAHHAEVLVEGRLENMGKASYDLTLEMPSHPLNLHGEVAKVPTTQRVGRRTVQGGPMDEGATRFVLDLDDTPVGLKLEHRDPMIKSLMVSLHEIWLPAWAMTLLGVLMVAFACVLDARITGKFKQSYLTITTTFAVLMSLMYFHNATPDMYIRNLVGSAMVGALVGVFGGLILVALARKVLPTRWVTG